MLPEDATVADAVSEDVGSDLLGDLGPFLLECAVTADLGQFGRAVQGDPTHQFGRNIVLGLSSGFPDSLVRIAPGSDGALCLGLHEGPQASWQVLAAAGV